MHYLYRHFDEEYNLLYVGVSCSPTKRTKQHSHISEWFPLVNTIKIERFNSKSEAEFAETTAIFNENPRFNIRKKYKSVFVPTSNQLMAEFYPIEVAAYYLKISKSALYQKIHRKNSPPFHSFGRKNIYFKKREIDQWLKENSK